LEKTPQAAGIGAAGKKAAVLRPSDLGGQAGGRGAGG